MKNFKNMSGFPESINLRNFSDIENRCKEWADAFGATPVLLPMIEKRELFERSIGDATDIVEKEMIALSGEDKTVLRPEGTAVAMRMWNNNGGLRNIRPQKWYYSDFMFRNETPQAGRYKQFKQFGMECIGFKEGIIDSDILVSLNDLFESLGVRKMMTLKINTIGKKEERNDYIKILKNWLKSNADKLDSLSLERMDKNPLRIFDSKVVTTIELLKEAPKLYDYLNNDTKESFRKIKESLSSLNIEFEVEETLVRGLDYYNGLVFEFITNEEDKTLNKTVCAGGRYDELSVSMKGEKVEAIGFGIGLERLVMIVEEKDKSREGVYICWLNEVPESYVLKVAREYRKNSKVSIDPGKRKMQKQLTQADDGNFEYCIIIGLDEVQNNSIKVKDLKDGNEVVVKLS